MSRPTEVRAALALVVLATVPGCARPPEPAPVEVGVHDVRFVVPAGWEHMDHGRQQIFRDGESQISLVDMGPDSTSGVPADPDSLARLLRILFDPDFDPRQLEIAKQRHRDVAGCDWIDLETWDRVSHTDRRRVAFTHDRGSLLVLRTERGLEDPTAPVFDAVLSSIAVVKSSPAPPDSAR